MIVRFGVDCAGGANAAGDWADRDGRGRIANPVPLPTDHQTEIAATASMSATATPIAQYRAVPRFCVGGSRTARSAAGKGTI